MSCVVQQLPGWCSIGRAAFDAYLLLQEAQRVHGILAVP